MCLRDDMALDYDTGGPPALVTILREIGNEDQIPSSPSSSSADLGVRLVPRVLAS